MALLIREGAAEYLTQKSGVPFKPEGLAALATKGTGPEYSIVNGRAVYETEALDEWLAARLTAKSPSARNRQCPTCPVAA